MPSATSSATSLAVAASAVARGLQVYRGSDLSYQSFLRLPMTWRLQSDAELDRIGVAMRQRRAMTGEANAS